MILSTPSVTPRYFLRTVTQMRAVFSGVFIFFMLTGCSSLEVCPDDEFGNEFECHVNTPDSIPRGSIYMER